MKAAPALGFLALAAVFLWAVLPLQAGMATHAEEAVGLTRVAPLRPGSGEVEPAPAPHAQLRTSAYLPVWGVLWGDGSYTPLLVDGHQGALVFAPSRLAHALGGLTAARALAILYGLGVLAAVIAVGGALGLPLAGWLAAAVLAASPHAAFFHHWVRPDEQATWALPLWALWAFSRANGGRRPGWLWLGAALLGLAVSAKLTAGWTLIALTTAVLAFRLVPRPQPFSAVAALILAGLPLLPQALFLLTAPDTGAFALRVQGLPHPAQWLQPDRLAFFARHFAEAFGGLGTYVGALAHGASVQPGPAAWGTAGVLAVGVLVTVTGALRRGLPAPQRAFGLGLGVLLLLYIALYYTGMSLFGLLLPWVPLAFGLAVAQGWKALSLVQNPRLRRGLGDALVVAVALVVANGLVQTHRMHAALERPQAELFARSAQQQMANTLLQSDTPVWTTTYNAVAVYETLTDGRVRPRHLHALFAQGVGPNPDDVQAYDVAWQDALRMVKTQACGQHQPVQRLLVSPGALRVDVSPLRHPAWIAQRLPDALRHGGFEVLRRQDVRALPHGATVLTLWTLRAVGC